MARREQCVHLVGVLLPWTRTRSDTAGSDASSASMYAYSKQSCRHNTHVHTRRDHDQHPSQVTQACSSCGRGCVQHSRAYMHSPSEMAHVVMATMMRLERKGTGDEKNGTAPGARRLHAPRARVNLMTGTGLGMSQRVTVTCRAASILSYGHNDLRADGSRCFDASHDISNSRHVPHHLRCT